MTAKMSFTKAKLKRAIETAREAGLRVVGIRPDGTLVLEERNNPQTEEKSVEQEREIVL